MHIAEVAISGRLRIMYIRVLWVQIRASERKGQARDATGLRGRCEQRGQGRTVDVWERKQVRSVSAPVAHGMSCRLGHILARAGATPRRTVAARKGRETIQLEACLMGVWRGRVGEVLDRGGDGRSEENSKGSLEWVGVMMLSQKARGAGGKASMLSDLAGRGLVVFFSFE